MNKLSALLLTIFLPAVTFAGPGEGGGTLNFGKMDEGGIRLMVEGGGLKKAVLNYLETVPVNKIDSKDVRNAFYLMMYNDALATDIQNSAYVSRAGCKDAKDQSVYASAIIGQLGGEICFDSAAMAAETRNLPDDQIMIKLAATALHEHVHHFQLSAGVTAEAGHFPPAILDRNEEQAFTIAGYVRLTAKIVQEPLLKWDPTPPEPMVFVCREQNPLGDWESAGKVYLDGFMIRKGINPEYYAQRDTSFDVTERRFTDHSVNNKYPTPAFLAQAVQFHRVSKALYRGGENYTYVSTSMINGGDGEVYSYRVTDIGNYWTMVACQRYIPPKDTIHYDPAKDEMPSGGCGQCDF